MLAFLPYLSIEVALEADALGFLPPIGPLPTAVFFWALGAVFAGSLSAGDFATKCSNCMVYGAIVAVFSDAGEQAENTSALVHDQLRLAA